MQNSKMFDHRIESKQQDVWLKKCCKRLTCWVTMLFRFDRRVHLHGIQPVLSLMTTSTQRT